MPSFFPCACQRGTILDELFAHVAPYLPTGPKAPRDFPASEDARTCIQMFSAAVAQMIQVGLRGADSDLAAAQGTQAHRCKKWLALSPLRPPPLFAAPSPNLRDFPSHLWLPPQSCVDLPAMDCEPGARAGCYQDAATCADYFWTLCFDRWHALAWSALCGSALSMAKQAAPDASAAGCTRGHCTPLPWQTRTPT